MMKTLRSTREQLLYDYPALQDVTRIRRSAAAFSFCFFVHGLEPCLGPGCKLCARRVPKDMAQGVRLWRTDLVIKYPNGATRFNTGSWHTHTTAKYMSIGLVGTPFSVGRKRGKWVVCVNDATVYLSLGGWVPNSGTFFYREIQLEDGMIL